MYNYLLYRQLEYLSIFFSENCEKHISDKIGKFLIKSIFY